MQLPCSTRQRVRPVLLLFAAMTWQGTKPPDQNRANKFIKKPDDNVLNGLNFDQIEILFRSKVIDTIFMCKNVYQTDQIYINFAFSSLNKLLENVAVQMRENYAHIKRMFMAMDRHLDGFIGLKELKSILTQFTIPLTDQLFSQLMDR